MHDTREDALRHALRCFTGVGKSVPTRVCRRVCSLSDTCITHWDASHTLSHTCITHTHAHTLSHTHKHQHRLMDTRTQCTRDRLDHAIDWIIVPRCLPHFSIHLVGEEINFSPSLDAKLYHTCSTFLSLRLEEGRMMSVMMSISWFVSVGSNHSCLL